MHLLTGSGPPRLLFRAFTSSSPKVLLTPLSSLGKCDPYLLEPNRNRAEFDSLFLPLRTIFHLVIGIGNAAYILAETHYTKSSDTWSLYDSQPRLAAILMPFYPEPSLTSIVGFKPNTQPVVHLLPNTPAAEASAPYGFSRSAAF